MSETLTVDSHVYDPTFLKYQNLRNELAAAEEALNRYTSERIKKTLKEKRDKLKKEFSELCGGISEPYRKKCDDVW